MLPAKPITDTSTQGTPGRRAISSGRKALGCVRCCRASAMPDTTATVAKNPLAADARAKLCPTCPSQTSALAAQSTNSTKPTGS